MSNMRRPRPTRSRFIRKAQPQPALKPKWRITLDVFGLIAALVSFYYLVPEPRIKYANAGSPLKAEVDNVFNGDTATTMITSYFDLVNVGWRRGYVDRAEVTPNGIKLSDYTINSIQLDKDYLNPGEHRRIR